MYSSPARETETSDENCWLALLATYYIINYDQRIPFLLQVLLLLIRILSLLSYKKEWDY